MTDSRAARLSLIDQFPAVPTSAWEEQIRRELKGADYEKRLVWTLDEGIAVRPYYRAEHAPRREPVGPPSGAWRIAQPGEGPGLAVDAAPFHDAGATAVQELAFAIAAGVDRLAAGASVPTMGFAVGSSHFVEIAKLRAARLLWDRVRAAFAALRPGAPGPEAVRLEIHARTAGENKTLFDPYVNLLRVTTEALSAIVGGCDALTITPCGFDPHLAENVHHILREESHLDRVADPGAGSYYVEALTDALAAAAWTLFQSIEAAGGWERFRSSGTLDTALAEARGAQERAVAARRRVLVGTNAYPNARERRLDAAGDAPVGWHLAAAFEAIRLRTERHARAAGRTPTVLLLERGDPKMRKARSTFCLNFFGCAGFDVRVADALAAADLVVLCSSDAEYLDLAREVCPRAGAPVLVAGNPKDQAEALRAVGVADFVHVQTNAVETLTAWQARLGMA